MPAKIRLLTAPKKIMQRAGYLKLLASQSVRTETSSLTRLGSNLVDKVTKRITVEPPFTSELLHYVQTRLSDSVYADLRSRVAKATAPIAFEIQDLYLSDGKLPSSTGKLVAPRGQEYPYLSRDLAMIKPGTWSPMTRASLLALLMPKDELAAWDSYQPRYNPMTISREQGAIILYSFIDCDAQVIVPLYRKLREQYQDGFDERQAADLLPEILRAILKELSRESLTIEQRERIVQIGKVASNIEQWRKKPYQFATMREEHIRPRLEVLCDLGLFKKPERHRFQYKLSEMFLALIDSMDGCTVDEFLDKRFFSTLARMHGITVSSADFAMGRKVLLASGLALKSSVGYAPILEVALLSGIRLLFEENLILEVSDCEQMLREWQKSEPDSVRFMVDRMGALKNVKFTPAESVGPSKSLTEDIQH